MASLSSSSSLGGLPSSVSVGCGGRSLSHAVARAAAAARLARSRPCLGNGQLPIHLLHLHLRHLLLLLLLVSAIDARPRPAQTVRHASLPVLSGDETEARQFPFQAAMDIVDATQRTNFFCGASILSPQFALTAAHCFRQSVYKDVRGHAPLDDVNTTVLIYYGSNQLLRNSSYVIASELWVYQEFNTPPMSNDFAVMKFHSPIQFNDNVQSIRLFPATRGGGGGEGESEEWELPEGADITISGWGHTSAEKTPAPPPTNLLSLTSDHFPDFCIQRFPDIFKPELMVCVGCSKNGTGACDGDSGGPATVASASRGGPIQVGILSWAAVPCGTGPVILAPVGIVLSWIESIVGIPLRSTVQAAPTFDCDTCPQQSRGSGQHSENTITSLVNAVAFGSGLSSLSGSGLSSASLSSPPQSCRTQNPDQAKVESLLPCGFKLAVSLWKGGRQALKAVFDFDSGIQQAVHQQTDSQSQSQSWLSITQTVLDKVTAGSVIFLCSTNGIGADKIQIHYKSTKQTVVINTPLTKPQVVGMTDNNCHDGAGDSLTDSEVVVPYSETDEAWVMPLTGKDCSAKVTYAALYLLPATAIDVNASLDSTLLPHYYQISLPAGKLAAASGSTKPGLTTTTTGPTIPTVELP